VQVQAKDEQIETMDADYFLTYGAGIQPRTDGPFPARARYVPVGSARIEQLTNRSPRPLRRGAPTILWVAESSTRNTHVTSMSEDTSRYLLEKKCLERLTAAARVQVVFRPYPHCIEYDGITRWVRRARLPTLHVDTIRPLPTLIARSDLVVMNTSSPTSWAEVIGAHRPMILFCDPRQTLLVPSFIPRLERACRWCRSAKDLLEAVSELSDNPSGVIARLAERDNRDFIADYVLGDVKGHCVERVATVLKGVLSRKS
jgi:hypothetical protein